jgi:Lysine methyltransferase
MNEVPLDIEELVSRAAPTTSRLGVQFTRASLPQLRVHLGDLELDVHQNCNSISSVVWDTGLLVCDFMVSYFSHDSNTSNNATSSRIKDNNNSSSASTHNQPVLGKVLDIGCGTGVVGMACLLLGASHVVFTDNIITESLQQNLQSISTLHNMSTSNYSLHMYDWLATKDAIPSFHKDIFDNVICSDVMYDEALHLPLLDFLSTLHFKRLIICFKQRYMQAELTMLRLLSEKYDLFEYKLDGLECKNFVRSTSEGTYILLAYPKGTL